MKRTELLQQLRAYHQLKTNEQTVFPEKTNAVLDYETIKQVFQKRYGLSVAQISDVVVRMIVGKRTFVSIAELTEYLLTLENTK